ncbi:MAG: class I SAM-dependent methyltransferase [Chloroflexota bacterium]
MIDTSPTERRLVMLGMFARHYVEQVTGSGYPAAADNIAALLTRYEKQTLFRLAKRLPAGSNIVEIGSFKGGSTYCFGAATQQSGAQIHCIDTFMTENVAGSEGTDTYPIFEQNTAPFADRIHIIRGFSQDVVDQITFAIDLLFIDGDHAYEGVSRDLRLYLPHLRPGGTLIMHDSAYPPVRRAIDEQVLPIEEQRLARLPNLYAGRIETGSNPVSSTQIAQIP